ncbi:MAG: hypothetical protein HQL20_05410 [Candidatus Omnitrophica bacterium]|nr:hypothetical protein [Candidatus Omnitrophota bacterium]
MKSLFIKVFMVFAAALCLAQGLVLAAVGLGTLSSEKLLALYAQLMAAPKALTAVLWVGGFFVLLGFILLILSARTRPVPHMIEVEKDGKPLNIPERAVREFILQILKQNPCASDVNVEFEHKGKGRDVEVEISAALDGVSSIYAELADIEGVLKTELERVFEWRSFTISFHLRGVGIDPKRKYFASAITAVTSAAAAVAPVEPPAKVTAEPAAALSAAVEPVAPLDGETFKADTDHDDIQLSSPAGEDEIPAGHGQAGKPHNSSFFSKMLLGK